jgi:dipeptidase E
MRDVVAIGGASAPSSGPTPIQRYVLSLARRPRPRVCFIPTASGDAQVRIDAFYAAFGSTDCEPAHLGLFANTTRDVAALMREQDVIYVGGGNTRNMLLLWRAWGVDTAIRAAWDDGAVLAGSSAGAICWFESGITDSYAGEFRPLPALGWLTGSYCPHYDSEPGRQPVLERAVIDGSYPPGYAVEDDVGVHIRDGRLENVIAWKPEKYAYTVSAADGALRRERIVPNLLPG